MGKNEQTFSYVKMVLKQTYVQIESDTLNSAPFISAQLTPGANTETAIAPIQLWIQKRHNCINYDSSIQLIKSKEDAFSNFLSSETLYLLAIVHYFLCG